jgi:HAD superfamily hydrolase (TIGR01509 family)
VRSDPVHVALILDFDGTMVDTEWPSLLAWRAIYARYGTTLALSDWVACVGGGGSFDPIDHLAQQLGPSVTLDRGALTSERLADKIRRIGDAPLMEGVAERMDEAAALGWPVAVASSSSADWVSGHLDRLGIRDRIAAVRTRDDVARTKPDPELFLSAAAALSMAPARCVVCEDSLSGIIAAKAAGMFAVAVPNRVTAGLDFTGADLCVGSLAQLSLAALGSAAGEDR